MSLLTTRTNAGITDIDKYSIVFLGTGYVSRLSLDSLSKHFDIEAIITKSDRSKGRRATDGSEVMQWSREHNIHAYTANTSSEVDAIFDRERFSSPVGVVVDFGVILSESVIDYFEFGILNSHFSLLPKWRGADPISFAIWSGDEETGVSLMRIVPALDEGDILGDPIRYKMKPDENTVSLTKTLVDLSNVQMAEKIPKYLDGDIKISRQDNKLATYSRKLTREDGIIDWNQSVKEIDRQIRALIEWPGANTTLLENLTVKILEAKILEKNGPPGQVFVHEKTVGVYAKDGALQLTKVQPASKSVMSGQDFFNGYKSKLGIS